MSQPIEKPWMTAKDNRFRTDTEPLANNGRISFEERPGAGGSTAAERASVGEAQVMRLLRLI